MTRNWWLFDAENQCAFRSASKIVKYLQGKHKPIYHPLSKYSFYLITKRACSQVHVHVYLFCSFSFCSIKSQ